MTDLILNLTLIRKEHNSIYIGMDLSIIILNYNGKAWLEKLLPSLQSNWLNMTTFETEVVVVDNASTDDSVAFVEKQKDVRLICSDRNGGFAYGNNLAIRNNSAKYLMLLNSDTEFLPLASNLDVLIKYMDETPSTGLITPMLLLDNGKLDPACHRGEPTPWAAFTYFSGLERLFPKSRWFGQYHQTYKLLECANPTANSGEYAPGIHDIDACTGAALLVRNEAVLKVGLLDERFFMYAEDLDWCKRFREAGYRVVFHPGVKLVHHKYRSGLANKDEKIKNNTRKWFYDTMLQYYDKHYKNKYPRCLRWGLKAVLTLKR